MKQKTVNRKSRASVNGWRMPRIVFLSIFFIVLMSDTGYSFRQDPRIPAANNPLSAELAPAIGRIRNSSNDLVCTAWIAQGGVLITAGHCAIMGDILEFNVPTSSGSCGQLNPAALEDQYIVNNIVASNNDGAGNDWKIFEVQNNYITGKQPIEAQLKYLNFVKKNVDNNSVPDIRLVDYGSDTEPSGTCYKGGSTLKKNSKSGTLQTQLTENITSNSSDSKLSIYNVLVEYGSSGGPMIDESTGEVVGLLNIIAASSVDGTTLHRSGFWTAFQNELTNFNLKVYQKNDAGSDLAGTTVERWNNNTFVDGSSGATKLNITVTEGNIEVLRGDQGVYNTPEEKRV
jgi:hypothetical protein